MCDRFFLSHLYEAVAKVFPSLAKAMALMGSLAKDKNMYTCTGGLGDNLSVLRVVDHEDVGNDNEEERAVSVESARVDYVGIRRLGFGLNQKESTICSCHFSILFIF
jgi:hypothetical protein